MHRKYYPFTIAGDLKNKNVLHMTADFETCLTEDETDVRVWAWGLANIFTEGYEDGTELDAFLDRLLDDKYIYDVAFHNLKFDGNYILPAIYKRGFKYLHNRIFMNAWKEGQDLTGYFTHSISEGGQFYNIVIVKPRKASQNVPAFVFLWDSLKLFPETLKKVGEQYNSIHKKIDEDADFYEEKRPAGHQLTERERLYLREDCLTLAEALRVQIEKYGKIYRTRASKAFSFFKDACLLQDEKTNVYEERYIGNKDFSVPHISGYEDLEGMRFKYLPSGLKRELIKKKLTPEFDYHIPDFETWDHIKESYHGGISYVNPTIQEQSIEAPITVIDVNSMYPHVMNEYNIPFGRFELREGQPTEPRGTWIACARVSFQLRDPYRLPCIQITRRYGREWLRESTDYRTTGEMSIYNDDVIWFTKVDFETFNESYNFTVHNWIEYYYFPTIGRTDGRRFVQRYYNAKQEAGERAEAIIKKHGGDIDAYEADIEYRRAMLDRQEAKVIMNSAYGKHGTKYIMLSQDSKYTPGEPLEFPIDRKIFNIEPEDPSHFYIPYAAFVTSYARQMLVKTWNSFKGKALYCDTDSIHFLGDRSEIPEELRPRVDYGKTGALGLWGFEGDFVAGRYIRAKTYIEVDASGKAHVTCAGATPAVKKLMDWETFRVGFNAWEIAIARGLNPREYSKLKPKRYPSGVNLEPENFQIKPAKY